MNPDLHLGSFTVEVIFARPGNLEVANQAQEVVKNPVTNLIAAWSKFDAVATCFGAHFMPFTILAKDKGVTTYQTGDFTGYVAYP